MGFFKDMIRNKTLPGMWAFFFHRISGIIIAVYLFFHILVTSTAAWKKEYFDELMALFRTPVNHFFEWLLFIAVVYHMLNGLRITFADLFGYTNMNRPFIIVFTIIFIAIILGSLIAFLPLFFGFGGH